MYNLQKAMRKEGGHWERLTGLTKMAVKKTLGIAHTDSVTLQTVITEVEAVLNDHTLTYISDDTSNPETLKKTR